MSASACPEPGERRPWPGAAPSPFAAFIDAVATLDDEDAMWDLLTATIPAAELDRLARQRLRRELILALRWRGVGAPSAVADAWLSPRRRRRAA